MKLKKSGWCLIVALVMVGSAERVEAAEERLNVLLLIVDDLNTWLLGDTNRYAGKVVAPNIRGLADSGVLFKHTYTASPYCSPSRTAFLSGVRPYNSGIYDNGMKTEESPALQNAIAFPELFKQAGYFTASYGKVSHGWSFKDAWDDQIPHKRDPVPPNAPLTSVGRGEQDWGPIHLDESEMRDTMYADAAIKQLRGEHDKPFFVACGLFHAHMPWYVPERYFELFPLDEVTTPELLENDLDDVPSHARALTAGKSNFVASVLEKGLHKQAVQAYLATTAYADAQMGRVLDALDESPYRDNTIVVLISDNGFHLAEKGHWQKATLWEEATHTLMMFRVPNVTRPGGVSPRFVSLQDLYPTLTELCGLEAPDYLDGSSLVSLLKNPDAEWRSTAISALGTQFGDRYVSMRNERYRYTRYNDDQEELYDCEQDPREWTNQIDNPEYAEVVEKLRTSVPSLSKMAPAARSNKNGKKKEKTK